MMDALSTKALHQAAAISHEKSTGIRFLPEIDRMRTEGQSIADMKADLLKNAADVMDAQADFLQTLIDRCKTATITHEELVVRLTAGLETSRTAARVVRSAA